MKLYNLKIATQQVDFKQAVIEGIGQDRGLFFVNEFKPLENLDAILGMDFVERSSHIIHHLIDGELPYQKVNDMVKSAFDFDVPMHKITDNVKRSRLHRPDSRLEFAGAVDHCVLDPKQFSRLTIPPCSRTPVSFYAFVNLYSYTLTR